MAVRLHVRGLGVLVGWLVAACGGGGANDPLADLGGEAAQETPGVEIVDTSVDEAPDVAWMPDQSVEASLVFPTLTSSEGIAVDDQGRFLLTANDALMRLGQDGTLLTLAPIPKAPGMPNVGFAGVAWHPSWGVVLAQTMGNRLHRWTEQGGLVPLADPVGAMPNGVLFDAQGRLLVSLSQTGSVVRLDSPEASPVTIATGIPFANGLALSADGATLYVASTTEGAVYQVPLTGALPYPASVLSNDPLLAGADGLLLSPGGWLLVAGYSKKRIAALDLATGATRVVSDAPPENLEFVANLAFGPGGQLDPGCLFATRLNKAGLARICP